ncbi:MAG: methyltransferase domain-containing protein [Bacteroidetes bacterium]|nr:methyltransferase domain-containing protein [Bacteroidota bacterium]
MSDHEVQYEHSAEIHNLKTPKLVVPIIIDKLKPSSVVDIGCGTGTWLRIFQDHGIDDILGVDGVNVDTNALFIPKEKFQAHDLRKKLDLKRKFDLVLSLEVAEHLEEKFSGDLVDLLTSLGDRIIFSAAIPTQGGQNHINEQWQSYWIKKFEERNFCYYDLIRPLVWDIPQIEFWYKQNMLFFCKTKIDLPKSALQYENILHPDLLDQKNMEIKKLYDRINNPSFRYCYSNLVKIIFHIKK